MATAWQRVINLYLDVEAYGRFPLLATQTSSNKYPYERLSWVEADAFKLRLWFRQRAASVSSPTLSMSLGAGWNLVVCGKSDTELDSETQFFKADGGDFTQVTVGTDVYYEALLNLNTDEMVAAFAALDDATAPLSMRIDIEVQASGNTERVTLQIPLDVQRQVYRGTESTPVPATPLYPSPGDILTVGNPKVAAAQEFLLDDKAANTVLAGPESGADAPPAYRALVLDDLPLSASARAIIALTIAKGDLIAGTGAATAAMLGVGADGKVLMADSTQATGMKWETLVIGTAWGAITGTLTDQTDLVSALAAKASATHATTHVTGGSDVIPSVVAGGNAGLMTGADKTKLNGIATSANNYTHPNHTGDVTSSGDGATTIAAAAVTLSKMADLAGNTLLGNNNVSAATPLALNPSQVRTVLSLVPGTDVQVQNALLSGIAGMTIAKGTLIGGSGAGTLGALGVGSNGQFLAADSSQSTGLSWVNGGVNPLLAEVRLSLSQTQSVITSDVANALNVWVVPHEGNRLSLYSSTWATYTLSSSLQLDVGGGAPTFPGSKNLDVWCRVVSGIPTLDSSIWDTDLLRHTGDTDDGLDTLDGVRHKRGDPTRRYMGSFRTTTTPGRVSDTRSQRVVWSMNNRKQRYFYIFETTNSWSYGTAAWRESNGGSSSAAIGFTRGEVLVGLAGDITWMHPQASMSSYPTASGVGLDGATTTNVALVYGAVLYSGAITADYFGYLGMGLRSIHWLEYGNGATNNPHGDNNTPTSIQSGMVGLVWA